MFSVRPASLRKTFIAAAFAALPVFIGGCAHAPVSGKRTADVLMPEINGHFKALKRLAADKQLTPVPEDDFNALIGLFDELKASPSEPYTHDPARWEHFCGEAGADVRALEAAWKAGDQGAVDQALQVLMGTRDDAHNAFAGHPAHSRGK